MILKPARRPETHSAKIFRSQQNEGEFMPALRAPDLKTLASAAELKASYAANRARLMGQPPVRAIAESPAQPATPLASAPVKPAPDTASDVAPASIVHDDIHAIVGAVAMVVGIEPDAV